MYEQYFAEFEFADTESEFCTIRLTHSIFNGVEVVIGKEFIVTPDQQEIKFDYEVSKIPEGFDKELVTTTEFIDLIKNIFMAILERELNFYETTNDESTTSEGSVQAGPETEEQGE